MLKKHPPLLVNRTKGSACGYSAYAAKQKGMPDFSGMPLRFVYTDCVSVLSTDDDVVIMASRSDNWSLVNMDLVFRLL